METSNTRNFIYSNTTENPSYPFCVFPAWTPNISTSGSFQYASTDYPQRTYSLDNKIYTNTTTNTVLYLLASGEGSYTTFQVLSTSGQPIPDVVTTAERQISGVWIPVGSGSTGADGGVTFWINPDFQHNFTFSKTGYTTASYLITPTQATYTIYLSGGAAVIETYDFGEGITYTILPSIYTLENGTSYPFNFTLTSDYWNVDEFGFTLSNSTDVLGTTSLATNGGFVNYTLNTGEHDNIIMNAYWKINGSYTNVTRSWHIFNVEEGAGWSLTTFFDDLKTYTDDEIFGLNEFSRTLLIFLIILLMVGGLSYMSGLYSPGALLVEIFALVAFFDKGLGLLPNPVNAIPNFPTIFVGLILLGYLFREGYTR